MGTEKSPFSRVSENCSNGYQEFHPENGGIFRIILIMVVTGKRGSISAKKILSMLNCLHRSCTLVNRRIKFMRRHMEG